MVLPVALGTLLRQRYLIQEILGQGGFGRTYLAIDQERFSERCVLKEFAVPFQETGLIEKSRTLFQREASILYQIQHPQVPRFRAIFEDEQRLFLVQSFIEGPTCRHLLRARKQQGATFSEAEVLHILKHLLSVLTYLHDREIIHRDISPENIILQPVAESQRETVAASLPVLIDFGAVKEATSYWATTSAITRVGKIGYAPPEQLQTGTVYPNSDLYALAATCLVLVTGQEPRTLLDGQTLTWQWGQINLSPNLAAVLKRMLAVYPGDRYASAREVFSDLQAGGKTSTAATEMKPSALNPVDLLATRRSGQAAIALEGATPESDQRRSSWVKPARPVPSKTVTQQRTRWNTSLRIGIPTLLLIALGVMIPIGWTVWNQIANTSAQNTGEVWVSGAKLPQSEAARIIESQGARSNSTNALTGAPFKQAPEPIVFPPDKISTVVRGTLQSNAMQPYVLRASQGQVMTVTLEGGDVVMNVLKSNQEAINDAALQTKTWTGQLPAEDEYVVQVTGSGDYSLDIAITPIAPPQSSSDRAASPKTSGSSSTSKVEPR